MKRVDFAATALLHLSADDRPEVTESQFAAKLAELKQVMKEEFDSLNVADINSLIDLALTFRSSTQLKNAIANLPNPNAL